MSQPVRNQVFISYSHLDSEWVERLKQMLRPLVRSNRISLWVDADIKPGRLWRAEIKHGLDSAKVAAARKLLIRGYIILRNGIDYAEFLRRGVEAGTARAAT